MKKVNNIIQIVKKSYEVYSDDFHTYFAQQFNNSLVAFSDFEPENILSYSHSSLNKFIDHCVYYRLGVTDTMPKLKDIVYDLSSTISPNEYEKSVDDVLREIVYCAFPSTLIKKLRKQLEAHKLEDKVIDHIVAKIECENPSSF